MARGGSGFPARAARGAAERFVSELALPEYDAGVLTQERELADYFEEAARESGNAKAASNWIMTELLRKLKDDARPLAEAPVAPSSLAALVKLVAAGTISGKIAKDVFEKMWATGESPSAMIEREGHRQLDDEGALASRGGRGRGREPRAGGELPRRQGRSTRLVRGPGDEEDRRPRKSAARQRALEEGARRAALTPTRSGTS